MFATMTWGALSEACRVPPQETVIRGRRPSSAWAQEAHRARAAAAGGWMVGSFLSSRRRQPPREWGSRRQAADATAGRVALPLFDCGRSGAVVVVRGLRAVQLASSLAAQAG